MVFSKFIVKVSVVLWLWYNFRGSGHRNYKYEYLIGDLTRRDIIPTILRMYLTFQVFPLILFTYINQASVYCTWRYWRFMVPFFYTRCICMWSKSIYMTRGTRNIRVDLQYRVRCSLILLAPALAYPDRSK